MKGHEDANGSEIGSGKRSNRNITLVTPPSSLQPDRKYTYLNREAKVPLLSQRKLSNNSINKTVINCDD